MARKVRRPRKARAQSARKSTQQANTAGKARREVRARLVALEARMTLLERSVWSDTEVIDMDAILAARHPEEE